MSRTAWPERLVGVLQAKQRVGTGKVEVCDLRGSARSNDGRFDGIAVCLGEVVLEGLEEVFGFLLHQAK